MFSIQLEWLAFPINLETVNATLRPLYASYSGITTSDNSPFALLWFSSDLSDDDVAAVTTYWNGLTPTSPEATSYQSQAQSDAAAAAAKAADLASATAKLTALGLTTDEIAALQG